MFLILLFIDESILINCFLLRSMLLLEEFDYLSNELFDFIYWSVPAGLLFSTLLSSNLSGL